MADFQLQSELFIPLVVVPVVYSLWYFGVFTSITFRPGNLLPMTFVYKTAQGPYSEGAPLFSALYEFLEKHGFEHSKMSSAGIYYDDPKTTKVPRYAVGFLIEQGDSASKEKWEKFQQDYKEDTKEWSVLELKETKTIVSVFPMRSTLSCALSAMRTYPAFESAGYKMKSGSMEIYRMDNKTSETHFPRSNYGQFCPQESDSFPSANDEKKVK